MAEYTEKIYASDSWVKNYTWDQLTGTTRGGSLTSQYQYSFTYDGNDHNLIPNSSSDICMQFLLSGKYKKKKLTEVAPYIYVTGSSSSASGNVSNGRFVFKYGINLYGYWPYGFTMDMPGEDLSHLTKNQYNFFSGSHYYRIDDWAKEGLIELWPGVGMNCTGVMYKNSAYSFRASLTMQSHTGANKPYVLLTYEDIIPRIYDCAPKSGFINEQADTVFRWRFFAEKSGVQQPVKQQGYQFRWRVTGQSAYQESTVTGGSESHTVPAGTFPAQGSIDWCVRVQSDDGIWSEWSSWMTLTTVDSKPTAAGLRPDLGYVDGNLPQVFSWRHVIATGTAQRRFEAQYRTADGDWVALAAEEGPVQAFSLLPGALPSGKVFWRVRTANSDGVWGDWSEEASIVVRASPPEPVIGQLDTAPLSLICWQAQDQRGYQVQIGPVDSKEQYGTEKQWRCPEYLPDGVYTAKVRVKNEFGLWSPWAQAPLTVQNRGTGRISLSGRVVGREILLSWSSSGTFSGFLVKRDEKIIAATEKTSYMDRRCAGFHRYEVIGRQENGHYVSSKILTQSFCMAGAAVAGLDGGEWISLSLRRDGPPVHRLESQAQVGYQHYYGYSLPVAEISQSRIQRHHFAFSLPDNESLRALQALVGKAVIYKDQWECCFTGILEKMTVDYKNGADVSFVINETQGEEVIE
jgi:hypothetical protein